MSRFYDSVGSYTIAEAEVLRATALYAALDLDGAERQFRLALEHAEAAEAMEFRALARHGLALVALENGDLAGAREHLGTALDEAREAGHGRALALLLASAGRVELAAGDPAGARDRLRESRQLRIKMGDRHGLAQNLEAEAELLSSAGAGAAERAASASPVRSASRPAVRRGPSSRRASTRWPPASAPRSAQRSTKVGTSSNRAGRWPTWSPRSTGPGVSRLDLRLLGPVEVLMDGDAREPRRAEAALDRRRRSPPRRAGS